MMFSIPSLALILRRLMVLMEFLLLFLRTVFLCCHPAWSNSFISSCQHLSFLPAGSKHTFNLCLRKVTTLIPPTTALWLYYHVSLKFLNQSLSERFLNTYQPPTFFLIASMDPVRSTLLVIFLSS